MPELPSPIDLRQWVSDNRSDLEPPVGNKKVFEDHNYMVFAVGGPNERKDYHVDPDDEFFYQIEGSMTLKVIDDGERRDITIDEGEVFLLPAGVPHSPQRPAETVGLVVEHVRPEGQKDGLRWYCDNCDALVYETYFQLEDIVEQLKQAIQSFWDDEQKRTCPECGDILQKP